MDYTILAITLIVWKYYTVAPWWAYIISFGFILWGRYNLLLWRKSIDPTAGPWKKALTETHYKLLGRYSTLFGIISYVLYIHLLCKNWQNVPVWFYFLLSGLIIGGIGLLLLWQKSVNSSEVTWDNILKNYYFIFGITSIICGVAGLMFSVGK